MAKINNPEQLNPQSPIPLYRQLADQLIAGIRRGDYPPKSRIPSENDLAATYGIGRPTVRQATEFLIRKKMLVRKRGAGTFVCNSHEVDLFSIGGTLSAFQKTGISIETIILNSITKITVEGKKENPFAGKKAYFFSRLVLANAEPVLIEDMYLHHHHFAGIDRVNLAGRSISQIADEQFYMTPDAGKQVFTIHYADNARAELLEIDEQTPVLVVKRHLDFPKAKNAVYAEIFCKTDKFTFSQEIRGL